MVSYHAEKDRADRLADKISDLQNEVDTLMKELESAKYERDCYRSVLVGMEFRGIDNYPSLGLDFCELLGIESATRIKKLAGEE